MKIFNLILSALFLSFAIVQYNDPDPLVWMTIYSIVAAVCALAAFKQYYRWLILLGLAMCAVELFTTLPKFINWLNMGMPNIAETMKAEEPHIEYTREFLGLILCIGTLIFQYIQARKSFRV
jgi:mannose/fructose/N-acetylgalactosamine-specific phosphotransferase system component IID